MIEEEAPPRVLASKHICPSVPAKGRIIEGRASAAVAPTLELEARMLDVHGCHAWPEGLDAFDGTDIAVGEGVQHDTVLPLLRRELLPNPAAAMETDVQRSSKARSFGSFGEQH